MTLVGKQTHVRRVGRGILSREDELKIESLGVRESWQQCNRGSRRCGRGGRRGQRSADPLPHSRTRRGVDQSPEAPKAQE